MALDKREGSVYNVNERSFIRRAAMEEKKNGNLKDSIHRGKILRAATTLFRRQGYHGTSTRQIALKAGVSLGNIYNHFPTKERLFATLLEEYEKEYFSPSQPMMKALAKTTFPDDIAEIGEASRQTVEKFADYLRLIYVDMIEFDAKHIARIFMGMRERYAKLLETRGEKLSSRIAEGVDPVAAMMTVTFSYQNFFIMEKLFNVKGHYGMDDKQAIRQFAELFRNGILPREERRGR
jgi:AcrR family transcriptional regulator